MKCRKESYSETKKACLFTGKPDRAVNLRLLVTTVEFVDTAGGVNELLFAGEEGVALGADANLDLGTGGLDVPDFAAGAGDDGILIGRMDVFFHFSVIPIVKLVNQNNFVRIQI